MTSDPNIARTTTDLRQQLTEALRERAQLEEALAQAEAIAKPYQAFGAVANMPHLEPARRALTELPPRIDEVKQNVSELLKRLTDTAIEEDRISREGRDFWFRRFMLSLQIGNGAAFLATVAGVLQAEKDVLPIIAVLAWAPAIYFGLGVTAAGLLPLLMVARRAFPTVPQAGRAAYVLVLLITTLSMGLFACGVGSVMVELTQLREPALRVVRDTGQAPPPVKSSKSGNAAPKMPSGQ